MATIQKLKPLQSGQFGSKIKIAKSIRKTAVEAHYSCIMQKTAPKTANIRKMRPFWKLAKMATMQRL